MENLRHLPALTILTALAIFQFAYPGAQAILLLCASVGLFASAFSLMSFTRLQLSQTELIVISIISLFFLSALFSYVQNPSELAVLRAKRFALWSACGIGPLLFMHQFVEGKIKGQWFSIALVISTVITGLTALVLLYYVDSDGRVAIGPNYPTKFGGIVSLNALICFYLALNERNSRLLKLALFIGMVCALLGAYASGSRGAWLGLSLLMPLIMLAQPATSIGKKVLILAVMVCAVIAAYTLVDAVSLRMEAVQNDLNAYFTYHNPANSIDLSTNSIGLRIEFWKASLLSIQQSPWTGVGDQYLGEAFADLIQAGVVSGNISGFDHVHNDFLQLAYSKGIPGMVLFVALVAMPVVVAPPQWRKLALIMASSYLVFGLTDCMLIRGTSVVYYFFLTAILLYLERVEPGSEKIQPTARRTGATSAPPA